MRPCCGRSGAVGGYPAGSAAGTHVASAVSGRCGAWKPRQASRERRSLRPGSTAPTRHEHETHCRGSGAASCWVYRCRESPTTPPGVLEPRQAAWLRFLTLRPAIRGRRASAASGRSLDGTGYGSAKMARKSSQKLKNRPPGVPPRYVARAGRGRGVRGARGRSHVKKWVKMEKRHILGAMWSLRVPAAVI